jgi:hypothetical protein
MLGVWLFLPLVAIGMAAVSAAVRAAGQEAARLGEELRAFEALQPALVELGQSAAATTATARSLSRN